MQQSMIPWNPWVFRSQEINENRKNNLQEYSQWEWARYRCTEQVDCTMMTSQM